MKMKLDAAFLAVLVLIIAVFICWERATDTKVQTGPSVTQAPDRLKNGAHDN